MYTDQVRFMPNGSRKQLAEVTNGREQQVSRSFYCLNVFDLLRVDLGPGMVC